MSQNVIVYPACFNCFVLFCVSVLLYFKVVFFKVQCNNCCSKTSVMLCWACAAVSRMTSGSEGHRQARSQTMPIIRGKNALMNPKLLQMMETGKTPPDVIAMQILFLFYLFGRFIWFMPNFVSRREHSGRGHAESHRYRSQLVHRSVSHCAGCTGTLCSPS